MQPAPIDVARLAHRPEIKSYTVDENKLAVSALLNNGRLLRLIHAGCAHSGAVATLWFESSLPASNINVWIKEAVALTQIAFTPGISKNIENGLSSGKYLVEKTDSRLVITGTPSDYFSYDVVFTILENGVMLSVSYSFS